MDPQPAQSRYEAFRDASSDPVVRGFLHYPSSPNGAGLVITHGAGGNSGAPLLTALAEKFSHAGYFVLRCDLPFRQGRPFGPPRPGDAARDREGLNHAVAALRKFAERIFLGGLSYGGRQSSMLIAEQPEIVEGLLLLSYPLHPPGKPEQLRVQHLANLRPPALFVHGTRDPFGSVEEMARALALVPARTSLMPIESTGHDLGFKGKSRAEDLPEKVLAQFQNFFQ